MLISPSAFVKYDHAKPEHATDTTNSKWPQGIMVRFTVKPPNGALTYIRLHTARPAVSLQKEHLHSSLLALQGETKMSFIGFSSSVHVSCDWVSSAVTVCSVILEMFPLLSFPILSKINLCPWITFHKAVSLQSFLLLIFVPAFYRNCFQFSACPFSFYNTSEFVELFQHIPLKTGIHSGWGGTSILIEFVILRFIFLNKKWAAKWVSLFFRASGGW